MSLILVDIIPQLHFHCGILSFSQIIQFGQFRGIVFLEGFFLKEAGERNLLLFRGNSARVLISCRCLDEGIDVPDANIGVVLSGSAVERQHIQRMGGSSAGRKARTRPACIIFPSGKPPKIPLSFPA